MSSTVDAVRHRNLTAALHRNQLDDAEHLLAALRQTDPASLRTRGSELEYLVRRHRDADALRLAGQLADQFPDSAHVLHWGGRAAYRARQYPLAEARFRASRRARPRWATQRWLGKTLSQLGRLDEAEALLMPLVERHPICHADVAWVHERRGDPDRALVALAAHLEAFPADAFARQQQLRLRAACLGPAELIEEIETLRDLGEPIEPALGPAYLQALLVTGAIDTARAYLAEIRPGLTPRAATSMGWVAYKGHAPDLAFELFAVALPVAGRNDNFLASFERAAQTCRRLDDLAALYRRHAERHPRLYGRLRRLGFT